MLKKQTQSRSPFQRADEQVALKTQALIEAAEKKEQKNRLRGYSEYEDKAGRLNP